MTQAWTCCTHWARIAEMIKAPTSVCLQGPWELSGLYELLKHEVQSSGRPSEGDRVPEEYVTFRTRLMTHQRRHVKPLAQLCFIKQHPVKIRRKFYGTGEVVLTSRFTIQVSVSAKQKYLLLVPDLGWSQTQILFSRWDVCGKLRL